MTTRITSSAFLAHGDTLLLMKRGLHKKLGPGMWAGIGGHMELDEITDPRALDLTETCLREIAEEAGIARTGIHNLRLKYISTRKVDREISLHYHHIGELHTKIPLPRCDEGEFHWVHKNDIPDLPMSVSVGEALRHWLATPENDEIYLVAVNKSGDSAKVLEL